MRTTVAALAAFVLVSGAAVARAQEEPAPASSAPRMEEPPADDPESAVPPERPHLQVLHHPYEISSFYRYSQSSGFDAGYEPEMGNDKYPIAGFYRSHGSTGPYSMFWSNG